MSKHTPGPWTDYGFSVYAETPQDIRHDLYRGFDEKEFWNGSECGFLIAESIPHKETRRLIAAAPDLLEALEAAIPILIFEFATFAPETPEARAMAAAQAAIAKAKGATL